MTKEKPNVFDVICDMTRIAKHHEAMESFFKDRIAELDADEERILRIIAKHQPISSCNLRNHTRKITKETRLHIESLLWYKGIVRIVGGKLTVHPAFMEMTNE